MFNTCVFQDAMKHFLRNARDMRLLLLLYCQGRAVRAVAYRMLFYNPHTGTYNYVYVYICVFITILYY